SHPLSTLFPYTTLFRSLKFAHRRCSHEDLRAAVRTGVHHPSITERCYHGKNRAFDFRNGSKADSCTAANSLSFSQRVGAPSSDRSEEHTSELQSLRHLV